MNKIITAIIIIVIILGGGYFLFKGNVAPQLNPTPSTSPEATTSPLPTSNEPTSTPSPTSTPTPQSQTKEVIYTNAGFSPSTLTIKAGETVTFKNQSSFGMWVGSAMHPNHAAYSGTSLQQHCPDTSNIAFDQCQSGAPGTSWSFTFTKKGTWGYHNHSSANHFGKIIVE